MRATVVILALSTFALAGCDGLFEVDNPTDILEQDMDDPRMMDALANSAEGALSDAYDLAVEYGGLPGDGIIHASTNQGNLAVDRGVFDDFNERHEVLYNELASARWTTSEVTRRLEQLVEDPSTDVRVANSYYWDAVARVTLADLFKEVPFDGGPPNSPADVYGGAIDILEGVASTAATAGEAELEAAAHGTMARAYRSLYFETGADDLSPFGQAREHAQAALDAVPDFARMIGYQTPGSDNSVFQALSGGSYYDVMGPTYANMRDPASGELDPRIEHDSLEVIGTFGDSIFHQTKYDDRSADIPVTRWQEAELIIAEYRLLNGELPRAVERINAVRSAAGLPAFESSDAGEIEDQLMYERKAEFWLELRRWQDMRYYGIVPDRWYPEGKQLGVDRRFPVSLREQAANENYDFR